MIPYPDLPDDMDLAARRAAVRSYMDACRAKLTADPQRMKEIRARASSLLAYGAWQQLRAETPRRRRAAQLAHGSTELAEVGRTVEPTPLVEEPAKRVANLDAAKEGLYKPRRFDGRLLRVPLWADEVLAFLTGRGKASCRDIAAHIGLSGTSVNRGINIMLDHGLLVEAGHEEGFVTVAGMLHQGAKLYSVAGAKVSK